MSEPAVTVVVPVYNAGEHLETCLKSLAAQDLAADDFEVVLVDDGSTDGSGACVDRFAATHPNVRVIHQAHSGGPGRPRNAGTEIARGEYVFYLDADDALTSDALRRMLAFAQACGSDVVVIGRVTLRERRIVQPPGPFRVEAEGRVRDMLASLTPHKLIRRRLLVEHGLRFPEGRITWEDGVFLSHLAPRVGRISVLEDASYYRKCRHPARLSRTFRALPRARAAIEIVTTLREYGADPTEVGVVAFRLYRRLLRGWDSQHFLSLPPDKQHRLVAAMGEAALTMLPDRREDARLRGPLVLRSVAFRTASLRVVTALAEAEHDQRRAAWLRRPELWRVIVRAELARSRPRRGHR